MPHKNTETRRAYHAGWRERNRETIRAKHREYMVVWRTSKAGLAAAERRPRKTARRRAWWR